MQFLGLLVFLIAFLSFIDIGTADKPLQVMICYKKTVAVHVLAYCKCHMLKDWKEVEMYRINEIFMP